LRHDLSLPGTVRRNRESFDTEEAQRTTSAHPFRSGRSSQSPSSATLGLRGKHRPTGSHQDVVGTEKLDGLQPSYRFRTVGQSIARMKAST
jgi:hypothetical protein